MTFELIFQADDTKAVLSYDSEKKQTKDLLNNSSTVTFCVVDVLNEDQRWNV